VGLRSDKVWGTFGEFLSRKHEPRESRSFIKDSVAQLRKEVFRSGYKGMMLGTGDRKIAQKSQEYSRHGAPIKGLSRSGPVKAGSENKMALSVLS